MKITFIDECSHEIIKYIVDNRDTNISPMEVLHIVENYKNSKPYFRGDSYIVTEWKEFYESVISGEGNRIITEHNKKFIKKKTAVLSEYFILDIAYIIVGFL